MFTICYSFKTNYLEINHAVYFPAALPPKDNIIYFFKVF